MITYGIEDLKVVCIAQLLQSVILMKDSSIVMLVDNAEILLYSVTLEFMAIFSHPCLQQITNDLLHIL